MRWSEIVNECGGKIVKGVNTTVDVQPGEIARQAAKFGNTVDANGLPPVWTGLGSKTGAKDTPNKGDPIYGADGTNPKKNKPSVNESVRPAPFYHATSFRNTKSILSDGYISGTGRWREICVTRNQHYRHGNHAIMFVINADKVRQRFKVEPYDYYGVANSHSWMVTHRRSEAEERIRSKGSTEKGGDTKLPLAYVDEIVLLPLTGPKTIRDAVMRQWNEIVELASHKSVKTRVMAPEQ